MSNIHTLQKIFPAGFDNGYGSLKLLVEGFEVVRVPSYITNAEMEDVPGRVVFNGTAYTIGGGCLLPGFKKLLEKNGFKILDNPVEANVSGLLEMAKTILGKNPTTTSLK